VQALARLSIRVFDPGDGFRLLGVVGAVRTATVRASIVGEYETTAGSTVRLTFEGVTADALPLKEFLDAQLRAAAAKDLEIMFTLSFKDGLRVSGDAPAALVEQLTRYATGAAYVEATAEALP